MADSQPLVGPLRRLAVFLVVGALALTFGGYWLLRRLPKAPPTLQANVPTGSGLPTGAAVAVPAVPGNSAASLAGGTPRSALPPKAVDLLRTVEQALAVLRDPAVKDKRPALLALREALDLANRNPAGAAAAIAAIRDLLARGEDAPTGERFHVSQGGALTEAPTLRTLLMDRLGTLSRTAGTTDAQQVATETLAAKDSADEWAVALRNVAWADPDGSRVLLAEKTREMLAYEPWRIAPSGGYLEAFDAAAYSRDATLMGDFARLSADANPLRRAALVGADRLAAEAPLAVADYLNANPIVLADRPLLRADFLGKLDLADPAQRTAAEAYLDRPDVDAAEKVKFLGRLEQPAYFASESLLTNSQPGPNAAGLAHRATVNEVAGQWLTGNRFPVLQAPLTELVQNTR